MVVRVVVRVRAVVRVVFRNNVSQGLGVGWSAFGGLRCCGVDQKWDT